MDLTLSFRRDPVLLELQNHAEPTFTPIFRWTAVRGAQLYKLQYTSDPTCNFGNAGLTRTVDTRNTSYTPTDALPNDVNYCWHVLAQSGSSVSGWSPTYEFIKKWYIQAVPLTPVNNYLYVKIPFLAGLRYLVQPIIKLRFARIIVSPA